MRNKAFNFSPLVIFCLLLTAAACQTQTATEASRININASARNSSDAAAISQTNELQTNQSASGSRMQCAPEKLQSADVLTIDFPKTPHGGFVEIVTPDEKFIFLSSEQNDELLEDAKAADVSPYYSAEELASLAQFKLDTATATTVDYEQKSSNGKHQKTKIFSRSGWYTIKLSETHFEQDDPLITAECRVYFADSLAANSQPKDAAANGQNAGEELIDAIKTLKGELRLVKQIGDDDAGQVDIKLGDKILWEAPYQTASFKEINAANAPNLFLVFLDTDSLQCIGKFVVVDLSLEAAKISEEFGNCSDAPQITYRNQTLTLTFPDGTKDVGKYKIGKKEVWQYLGGRLKKLS